VLCFVRFDSGFLTELSNNEENFDIFDIVVVRCDGSGADISYEAQD